MAIGGYCPRVKELLETLLALSHPPVRLKTSWRPVDGRLAEPLEEDEAGHLQGGVWRPTSPLAQGFPYTFPLNQPWVLGPAAHANRSAKTQALDALPAQINR
jgi:hypothetical protein